MPYLRTFSKVLFFLCLTALLFSCGDTETKTEKTTSYFEENKAAFSKKINLENHQKVTLSSEAENAVSDWSEFISANSEIDKLEDISLQNFISNADNIVEVITKLDSIPKNFKTTPIHSRVNVLNTKAKVFEQDIKRPNLTPEMVNHNAVGIYVAFQNLKIQINEVFLRKISDLDFDLD